VFLLLLTLLLVTRCLKPDQMQQLRFASGHDCAAGGLRPNLSQGAAPVPEVAF